MKYKDKKTNENEITTMGIIIGIDVGISTTKIVGLREGRVLSPIRITAADQVTSLYGAFGKYLHDNKVELKDVEQVMLTGVGAGYIDESLYGIPTRKVDEFVADGLGARFESGLSKAIVVSMGTGTSFVQCDGDDIRHIGGIGIGGGTLMGLSRVMLNTRDPKQIQSLATSPRIHCPACLWTPPPRCSRRHSTTPPRRIWPWDSSSWYCRPSALPPFSQHSTQASRTSCSLVT